MYAFGGHVDAVKYLIGRGAPVDKPDTGGESPLLYAIESGAAKVVEVLVANGADVNLANNQGFSPLDFALEHGAHSIMDFLESQGAKLNKYAGKALPVSDHSHTN